MSYSIWGSIAETPWWFYLAFIMSMAVSYRATKPRFFAMKSSIVLLTYVISISICAVITMVNFNQHTVLLLIAAIFLGGFSGWLQCRIRNIKAIRNNAQFFMPGSWGLFILFFALLSAKFYYYGYSFSFDPEALKQEDYSTTIVMLCGLGIGLSMGRIYFLIRCMKYGPFLET